MATNYTEEQLAQIAATKARKQLLAALEIKFKEFSGDGRKLFVNAFIAVRALVERDLNQDALDIITGINLTPYEAEHPDWPGIKADIIALFP